MPVLYTDKHTHTCILKPSENSEPTGPKVDILPTAFTESEGERISDYCSVLWLADSTNDSNEKPAHAIEQGCIWNSSLVTTWSLCQFINRQTTYAYLVCVSIKCWQYYLCPLKRVWNSQMTLSRASRRSLSRDTAQRYSRAGLSSSRPTVSGWQSVQVVSACYLNAKTAWLGHGRNERCGDELMLNVLRCQLTY